MRSSLHSGHSTLKLNSDSRGADFHLEGGASKRINSLILTVYQVVDSLISVRATLARVLSIEPGIRSLITGLHAEELHCCHQGLIIMAISMYHVLPDRHCLQF